MSSSLLTCSRAFVIPKGNIKLLLVPYTAIPQSLPFAVSETTQKMKYSKKRPLPFVDPGHLW
jgi:hypothetical protein